MDNNNYDNYYNQARYRTRVTFVRGACLSPLTAQPYSVTTGDGLRGVRLSITAPKDPVLHDIIFTKITSPEPKKTFKAIDFSFFKENACGASKLSS